MGLTKRLLDEQARGGVREVPDPSDSISRYVCRRCVDGFLQREARCCSCVKGRKRAKRMALTQQVVVEEQKKKVQLRLDALAGDDFSGLLKRVPRAPPSYGFDRWRF